MSLFIYILKLDEKVDNNNWTCVKSDGFTKVGSIEKVCCIEDTGYPGTL